MSCSKAIWTLLSCLCLLSCPSTDSPTARSVAETPTQKVGVSSPVTDLSAADVGNRLISGIVEPTPIRQLPHGGLVFACTEGVSGLTKYGVRVDGRFEAGTSSGRVRRLIAFERTDPVLGAWRGPSQVIRLTKGSSRTLRLTIPSAPPLEDDAFNEVLASFVVDCGAA
jgi:hypothetical protein